MSLAQANPTEWQWRTPQDGKIDGKTRAEWQILGVAAWARIVRDMPCPVLPSLYSATECNPTFSDLYAYAPATMDGLPAPWPALWQWRKLERDMDARTWKAADGWKYGGFKDSPESVLTWRRDEWALGAVVARGGEWWAPSDQDGNPGDWPEVEPQPVVVIPAAEMTACVLYGHQAMGGEWLWRDDHNGWTPRTDGEDMWHPDDESLCNEQWTPCDERGEFCELRRVVSEQDFLAMAEQRTAWQLHAMALESRAAARKDGDQ